MKDFKTLGLLGLLLLCFSLVVFQYVGKNNNAELEMVELYKGYNELRDKIGTKRDSIIALLKSVDHRDSSLFISYTTIDSLYTELDNKISNSQETIKGTTSIAEVKKSLEVFETEFDQLSNDEQNVQKRAFWNALNEKNDLIHELRAQVDAKNRIIDEQRNMIALRDGVIKQQLQQLEEKDRVIKDLINQQDISDETKSKLRKEMEDGKSARAAIEEELEKKNSQIENQNRMISDLDKSLKKKEKMVISIAKNSLEATYRYKEDKGKKEKIVHLNTQGKHTRNKVKTINIKFIISENMIKNPNNTIVNVGIYDSNNQLVNSKYSEDVTIENFEGKTKFIINPKLKKGNYQIKVLYHGNELHNKKFKITPFIG